MITVFGKKWFKKYNKQLCYVANSFIGDWIFKITKYGHDKKKYGKITEMHPNAITHKQRLLYNFEKKKTEQEYTTQFFGRNEYALRLQKVFYPIWLLFHAWDMLIANPFKPAWNLGFDTLTVYPVAGQNSPVDGSIKVLGDNEIWATIKGLANATHVYPSTGNDQMVAIVTTTTTSKFQTLVRSFFLFDTSALTADATISAATMSIYGIDKYDSFTALGMKINVYTSEPADDDDIVVGDFDKINSAAQSTSINHADWASGSYNDWDFLAPGNTEGCDRISLTGISKFGIKDSVYDAGAATPSWESLKAANVQGYFADNGSNKPKLVVTYTTGATHTLECATGSYILTGQDIGLLRTYRILIETGNYALTGIDVGLSKAYKIACETGSYILTGTDTILKASYKLVCEVGSFTLTGIAITLSKGYNIICECGRYVLTGIAIKLTLGWRNKAKSSTIWTNKNKASTAMTNKSKNSTALTNKSKNSTSFTNKAKVSTTFTNKAKN